jgi:hypothetical protein
VCGQSRQVGRAAANPKVSVITGIGGQKTALTALLGISYLHQLMIYQSKVTERCGVVVSIHALYRKDPGSNLDPTRLEPALNIPVLTLGN